MTPSDEQTQLFISICDKFLRQKPLDVIGKQFLLDWGRVLGSVGGGKGATPSGGGGDSKFVKLNRIEQKQAQQAQKSEGGPFFFFGDRP